MCEKWWICFFEMYFLIEYLIPYNLSKPSLGQPHSVQKKRKAPNSTDPLRILEKAYVVCHIFKAYGPLDVVWQVMLWYVLW